jgi:hypothetical protein
MEVSGQLHVPAALTPRKKSPVAIGHQVGWAKKPVWALLRREEIPALPVIGNPLFIAQCTLILKMHFF